MKEGLLVGAVPAEDTRVEKSELPLQHLQAGLHHFPESHWKQLSLHPRQPKRKRAEEKSKGDVQETNLQAESVM